MHGPFCPRRVAIRTLRKRKARWPAHGWIHTSSDMNRRSNSVFGRQKTHALASDATPLARPGPSNNARDTRCSAVGRKLAAFLICALAWPPASLAQPLATPATVAARMFQAKHQCLTEREQMVADAERQGEDACGNQGCTWLFQSCESRAIEVASRAYERVVSGYGSRVAPTCQAALEQGQPGQDHGLHVPMPHDLESAVRLRHALFLYSVAYDLVLMPECRLPGHELTR